MKKLLCFYQAFFLFLLYSTPLIGEPSITRISPNAGPNQGGTTITIKGSGFKNCKRVYFGEKPAKDFIVNSDSSITAITPYLSVGVNNIRVKTDSGTSPKTSKGLYVAQGNWSAIVPNLSNSITFLNLANLSAELLPIKGSKNLSGIAITPDGKRTYITDKMNNAVYVIGSGVEVITEGIGVFPSGIAITPDGTTAYVTNQFSDSVSVIDLATNIVSASIPISGMPLGIAITPDGKTAFVTNSIEDSVTPIDLATLAPGSPISILPSKGPCWIGITPDGTCAYVANRGTTDVVHIDIATNTVIGAPIATSTPPVALAIDSDGKKAYVTNPGSNNLTIIDLATDTAQTSIYAGSVPYAIGITPDSRTAYVTTVDGLHFVIPIDLSNATAGSYIPNAFGGNFPSALAITPDQAPLASFWINADTVQANASIDFDASRSCSPVGSIVRYDWDFGDGSATTTTTPLISHTYQALGDYTATLTVTNSAGTSTFQVFTGQTVSRNGGPTARASKSIHVVSSEPPAPPSNFKGMLVSNGKPGKEIILHASWVASPSKDVVFYRIYQGGNVIKTIKANESFKFVKKMQKDALEELSITAVSANHQESIHVQLKTSTKR